MTSGRRKKKTTTTSAKQSKFFCTSENMLNASLFAHFHRVSLIHCNGINLKYSFLSSIGWLHAGFAYIVCRQFAKAAQFHWRQSYHIRTELSWDSNHRKNRETENIVCLIAPCYYFFLCVCLFSCKWTTISIDSKFTQFVISQTVLMICKWLQLAHLYVRLKHNWIEWFALILHCLLLFRSSSSDPSLVGWNILIRNRRNTNSVWIILEERFKENNTVGEKKTKTCVTVSQIANFNGQLISIVEWYEEKKQRIFDNLSIVTHTNLLTKRKKKKERNKTKRKTNKWHIHVCFTSLNRFSTLNISKQTLACFGVYIMQIIWNILGQTHVLFGLIIQCSYQHVMWFLRKLKRQHCIENHTNTYN